MMLGGLLTLGLVVTVWLLKLNPRWYYRRCLSLMLPVGPLSNTLGAVMEIHYHDPDRAGGIRWDGTISGWFFAAWAVVIVALIAADYRQNPGQPQ